MLRWSFSGAQVELNLTSSSVHIVTYHQGEEWDVMPGLVRKLRVFATSQGVVLQPLAVRHQRGAPPIRIDYETHSIKSPVRDLDTDEDASDVYIEVYGIVGEYYWMALGTSRTDRRTKVYSPFQLRPSSSRSRKGVKSRRYGGRLSMP